MTPEHDTAMMARIIRHHARAVRFGSTVLTWIFLGTFVWAGEGVGGSSAPGPQALLARGNLIAWEVKIGGNIGNPEERAAMLERLGFRHYAYLESPVATSDADVD